MKTAATAAASHRHLRVLLAEDNYVNQRVIIRMLEKRGHCVRVTASGSEALHLARTEPFDIILMDVQMPGLDGLDVCRRPRHG